MNKRDLGISLRNEIKKGYDIVRISRWAFHLFNENISSLDPYLTEVLQSLFSMEDDPQFEFSEQELLKLADDLIMQWEQDELKKIDPKISVTAIDLGENWLMCPICQEVWIIIDSYSMTICPKCGNKLIKPQVLC